MPPGYAEQHSRGPETPVMEGAQQDGTAEMAQATSLQAVAEEKRSLGIEDGSLRRFKVLGAAAQVAYATL